MQSLTQPTLLLKPFCQDGDKNQIPVQNDSLVDPQLADLTNGFPEITSKPPAQGGLPPERRDFNALGYLTTSYDWFYQAGGTFTFNQTICDAIDGYPFGARLWYIDNNGLASILRSTIGNNTNNFLTDSSVIGEVGSGKPWVIDRFRGLSSQYDLFDHKWSDYQLNDQNWLRADTFSWQDGTVYSDAYNHLVADIQGRPVNSETINGTTIYYWEAVDGHKIIGYDENTDDRISAIYNSTGVAWYYILDQANQRFKLPRENPAREELIQVIRSKGNGLSLGLTNGTTTAGLQGSAYADNYAIGVYTNSYGINVGSNTSATTNIISGSVGITTDPVKSGIISSMTDSTSVYKGKKYLYFYVGQFSQSATEQTAGLNAELFNGKMDRDMSNMNASASAKQTIVGWGIPDYSAGVSISSGYTAPSNGYVVVIRGAGSSKVYLYVDSVQIDSNESNTSNEGGSLSAFVAKGSIITWTTGNISGTPTFFPLIGG